MIRRLARAVPLVLIVSSGFIWLPESSWYLSVLTASVYLYFYAYGESYEVSITRADNVLIVAASRIPFGQKIARFDLDTIKEVRTGPRFRRPRFYITTDRTFSFGIGSPYGVYLEQNRQAFVDWIREQMDSPR